jgi:hypothetical protein
MPSTITIYQSQSVLFTDTSSGGVPPYSRLWSFTGGDISSSTGATALVTYSNPGAYTASLTVTDDIGVAASYNSLSGITVNPPVITASFTNSPSSSVLMSQTISFTDTTTGLPVGATGWSWSIGGSGFATTQNSSLTFNDWVLVPGSSIADPAGTSLSANVSLLASNSYTSDTESKNITFSKVGTTETTILNRSAPSGAYSRYADVSYSGVLASSLGYPTATYVYEIDLASYGHTVDQFHSDREVAYMVVTGLTGKPEFLQNGVSTVSGYILVDDSLYGSGAPEISLGRYLTPALNAKKIFFTDSGTVGNITNLITAKNWTTSLISSVLTNIYPQLNSAQGIYYGIVYPASAFSSGRNPIVYSPQYLASLGASGQSIEIGLDVVFGTSYSVVCNLNDNAGVGNETGGDYYLMQSVGGNLGVAAMLNSAIAASSVPGGTASIEFVSDSTLNIYPGSTPASYSGLRMEVKNRSITSVSLSDNTETLNATYGLSLLPVFYNYTGTTQPSCIGMPPYFNLNNLDYLSNGTSIVYGNSIF